MLRYLSEQVKAGLEPFGIGIILAQIKVCGAKLWRTIDVKTQLTHNVRITNANVPKMLC